MSLLMPTTTGAIPINHLDWFQKFGYHVIVINRQINLISIPNNK